ncbi:hypothetical protein HH308_23455 [Gordonia sp. TBRC 11910]|uniref:SnoaL-like domain-containing protein n=1 Tax=Gordonia asplenii TaxID=2725283 RepID=A0A848L9B8_9ACTN|nr:hypothetical protein [Gordonia asplenii]NMO04178.1 hypothetical protein [Gordonia asplenii]
MTELSVEEMEAILYEHEIREASQDVEWTMGTVVDDPHYEFPTGQISVDGRDAVAEHYRRALPSGVEQRAASQKRVHGSGPNTLFREATFSFDAADGTRRTGQYVAVIEFDPASKKIVSERQYGDTYFAEFLAPHLGDDYARYPGVSLLNDGLAAVSREQMLEEAEAGRANPGTRSLTSL